MSGAEEAVAALLARADALRGQKHLVEAIAAYRDVLGQAPAHPVAAWRLATLLIAAERPAEAVPPLEALYAADPANAAVRERLATALQLAGLALWQRRRPREAGDAFRRACAIDPARIEALDNANAMLLAEDRFEEAAAAIAARIARHGDNADVRVNLGLARRGLGDNAAARAELEAALSAAPGHRLATWNLAWLDLEEGDLRSGFARYRSAWPGDTQGRVLRTFAVPRAESLDGLAGRTLLVHADEGFGDTLLDLRFVPALAARGIAVVLEVQPALVRLARSLDGATRVIATDDTPPRVDAHASLYELPWLLEADLAHLEPTAGYLRADADATAKWRRRLAPKPGERLIGLAWSGNAVQPNDHIRSMPFEALAPIISLPGCRFVSLQKDVRPSDAAALAAAKNVVQVGPEFGDFTDTAACLAALDLVIAVDSSLANLAGALGAPTWVLLCARPDWRYVRGRRDCPWYRSFTLWRPGPGEPASAASSVPHALRALRDFVS